MENCIKITGKLIFDPDNVTKKQHRQGEWKKIAMVMIPGDAHLLYAWFTKKRYGLSLIPPMRGAHITFINDRTSEMNGDWEKVKSKWQGKEVEVLLDVDPRSDELNWWLNIPNEYRDELHAIRSELGIGRPHFGLHMTFGTAVNKSANPSYIQGVGRTMVMNEENSIRIINSIRNGHIK